MKIVAALIATVSLVSAFSPQPVQTRQSTSLNALFDNIAGMDLFNPENNKYGSRNKKNLKQGKLGSNSYVPAGLTPAQYAKIREADAKKKEANYKKNEGKAFKYLGFNEFYQKRGTDLTGSWAKSPTKGHRMAKTKYDFDNVGKDRKNFESVTAKSIFGGKK